MSTVTEIIADARNYASDTYSASERLIRDAQTDMLGRFTPSPIDAPNIDTGIDGYDISTPPSLNASYNAPAKNITRPTMLGVSVPNEITIPDAPADFDRTKLWEGDPPVFDVADFNKDAPEISAITLPDVPDFYDVPFPEIQTPIMPEFSGVVLPEFNPDNPLDLPPAPEDIVKAYKETYANALPEMKAFIEDGMEQILSKYAPEYENNRSRLITKINEVYDGGTALTDSVEQQIYDRGRSRAEQEQVRLTTEIQENAAKRGMFVPDGAVVAGMYQVQASAAMANALQASETAIERAKIELDHLQFIMTLSNGIKDQALNFAVQHAGTLLQVNAQALDHAKTVANVMTELYNLTLKRYEQSLAYYKIEAEVWETKFKAAMADLEVFKIEAEAAKLTNEINKSEVDIYVARLNAQKTQVEIYATQVRAIETQIKAESAAVSAFGEEVRAYSARLGAKQAEFNVYKAALDGNKTLVDVYSAEVSAYRTKVEAEKAIIDTELAAAKTTIEYNRSLIEQYKSELEGYKTDIQAESTAYSSATKAYIASLDAYKADLAAKQSLLDGQVKKATVEIASAVDIYKAKQTYTLGLMDYYNTKNKATADIAMAGANTYTTIAGAALSAQNTMVTLAEE